MAAVRRKGQMSAILTQKYFVMSSVAAPSPAAASYAVRVFQPRHFAIVPFRRPTPPTVLSLLLRPSIVFAAPVDGQWLVVVFYAHLVLFSFLL